MFLPVQFSSFVNLLIQLEWFLWIIPLLKCLHFETLSKQCWHPTKVSLRTHLIRNHQILTPKENSPIFAQSLSTLVMVKLNNNKHNNTELLALFSSYSHLLNHKMLLKESFISLSLNEKRKLRSGGKMIYQISFKAAGKPEVRKNVSATAFIYGQNSYLHLPNPCQCLIQINIKPFVVKQRETTNFTLWLLALCENWSYNRNMEKHTGNVDRRLIYEQRCVLVD